MQSPESAPTSAVRRIGGPAENESPDAVALNPSAVTVRAAPETSLCVVVPVYNGGAVIAERVRALEAYLAALGVPSELIVVDDGSTDDTASHLVQLGAGERGTVRVSALHHPRNRGKGAAIITGMRAAHGSVRVFVDADHAYPPAEIGRIVSAVLDGADVAVACRVHADSRLIVRPGNLPYVALRFVVGRVLHWIVRPLLRLDLRDTQAGLKGFRGPVAERLFQGWLPRGFSFDLALLFRARRLHLRIAEVPVVHTSLSEPSTVRLLRDTATMVRDVAQIRLGLIGDHFEAWDSALRTRRRHLHERIRSAVQARAVAPLLLAIAAFAFFILLRARHTWESIPLAAGAWLVMVGTALVSAWRVDSRTPRPRAHWFRHARERRIFVAILVLGAIVRTFRLEDLPPMMHGDSAWCGNLGLMLLRGEVHDVFDFSAWYHVPFLSFVPYTASFLVNDVTVFGLRLPSAILGTLVIPPLYALTRAWFGARPAALATFLYAVGHASVHFSRIGLWNVQVAFYGVSAFALVVRGIQRGSVVRLAGAGMLSGLALYSYTGGRQISMVILLYFGAEWVRTRRLPRGVGHYLAALALAIVPLLDNYARDPGILQADRAAAVWALSDAARPHVEASLGVSGTSAILREQISRTLRGFVTLGDASTQYETSQPILSWPLAALAAIGFLVALWRWRQPRFHFLLFWLGLALLLGSVLIIDPPSYTRFVLLFPGVYIIVAVGLEAVLRGIGRHVRLGRFEVALACLLVAGQAAIFNLSGYYRFTQQVALMPREWDVLKVVERLGVQHDVYLFTGPLLLADSSIFQLFSPDTRTVSGFTPSDIPATLSHDTAFILTPEFRGAGRVITERFPGVERDVVDVHGVRQLAVYRCTAANACRGAS